ncbi:MULTISPECIES: tyrosine-protein phosphatase [Bacillus]|nr:tyrosine-protein phosphatase [Bacillus rhizoplanae]
MFEIRVKYLQAVVNEINIIHGSVEQYTEQEIGFTKDKLEERENLRERV